jgi:hypothetical protein
MSNQRNEVRVLLYAGLVLLVPWIVIGPVHADSGGVQPFKGAVIKCVGFALGFGEQGWVYVHNDGTDEPVVRVRFLDATGKTSSDQFSSLSRGNTVGFKFIPGNEESSFVMVAKITSSFSSVIVDAERVALEGADGSVVERRHITCAPSNEAPDSLPVV